MFVRVIRCQCVAPLFLREINGGVARYWGGKRLKNQQCVWVRAVPAIFTTAPCYFCLVSFQFCNTICGCTPLDAVCLFASGWDYLSL